MAKNQWGIKIPQKQLAFVAQWYYIASQTASGIPTDTVGYYRHRGGASTWEDQTDALEVFCPEWQLRTTDSPSLNALWNASHVTPAYFIMNGVNVYKESVYGPPATNLCNASSEQHYVDWWLTWIENAVGSIDAWDGIRMDLTGNIHSDFSVHGTRRTDMDLNGCPDIFKTSLSDSGCNSDDPSAAGRRYFDDIFRDGIQEMFAGIHQQHPDWMIMGNDSWMPASISSSGTDVKPEAPGLSTKPDFNATISEDWTDNWWYQPYPYNYTNWPDPVSGNRISVNFARTSQIIKTWLDSEKDYVIFPKWCRSDQRVRIISECGDNGNLDKYRMYREFRFSLAAATALGTYHGFMNAAEKGFSPTWLDDYAVYLDSSVARGGKERYKAAIEPAQKAAGIGWLGLPVSPMMTVDVNGDEDKRIEDVLDQQTGWEDYINQNIWIRYFEHGVVLLNPTGQKKENIRLKGDFYRFLGSSWPSKSAVGLNQNGTGTYPVNDGAYLGVNPEITMWPYDGLLLVKEEPDIFEIVSGPDDVEIGGYKSGSPGEGYEWRNYQATANAVINIGGDFLDWKADSTLEFRNINVNAGAAIDDMFLRLYIEPYSDLGILAVDSNDHHGFISWNTSFSGPGWVSSVNLKDILIAEVNASTWDNTLKLYLTAPTMWNGFRFRSYDYGGTGEFAPRLLIRHRGGGTPPSDPPTVVYQHGVNNYTSGGDTHIVTTNWEPPTPHDTFPILYLRTSRSEDEVKSSPVEFNNIALPPNAQVTSAVLALYYSGQSVNGGDINAYIADTRKDWIPPQTTWPTHQNNQYWQFGGAKGMEDRNLYSSVRILNYTEVGSWVYFNVTPLVREGLFEFILHASSRGVNKDVQFPSNEYWDPSKRPRLMIWYE